MKSLQFCFPSFPAILGSGRKLRVFAFVEDNEKTRGSTLSSDVSGYSRQAPMQFPTWVSEWVGGLSALHNPRKNPGNVYPSDSVQGERWQARASLPRLAQLVRWSGAIVDLTTRVINCGNVSLPFSCFFSHALTGALINAWRAHNVWWGPRGSLQGESLSHPSPSSSRTPPLTSVAFKTGKKKKKASWKVRLHTDDCFGRQWRHVAESGAMPASLPGCAYNNKYA